jgi:hypothetical protein
MKGEEYSCDDRDDNNNDNNNNNNCATIFNVGRRGSLVVVAIRVWFGQMCFDSRQGPTQPPDQSAGEQSRSMKLTTQFYLVLRWR